MVVLPSLSSVSTTLAIEGLLRSSANRLLDTIADNDEATASQSAGTTPLSPSSDPQIEAERVAAENAARLAVTLLDNLINSLVENARQNALTGTTNPAATLFPALQAVAAYQAMADISTASAINDLLLADRLALAAIEDRANGEVLRPTSPSGVAGVNIFA